MHQSHRKTRGALVAAVAGLALTAASRAAVIEFSEVPLANLTPLAGSEAYASYGLHFAGSTTYAIDTRFTPGAGNDTSGITTGPDNVNMDVLFDAGATSVSFKGMALNTEFFATVYDSNDNQLDTIFFPASFGLNYVAHTFSGVGTIARIEFHDNNQFIGVGQIEFTPVPEPTATVAAVLGLGALFVRARRRA